MFVFPGTEANSGGAYEYIDSYKAVGSNIISYTFENIPQNYKHLQIRGITRSSFPSTQNNLTLDINGDTTNTSHYHVLYASGNSIFSYNGLNFPGPYCGAVVGNSQAANILSPVIIDILDYTSSTKYKVFKSMYGFSGNLESETGIQSSVFMGSLAAITSINIVLAASAAMMPGTVWSLYGIRG